MAKITRVNGNVQAFASASVGTERTIFGEVTQSNDLTAQFSSDFLRGWGIVGPSDQPALEDFNGAMYTHGQLLAYLHQMGVAEYNATQEYHIGSVTQVSGSIYISIINNNIGNAPASSPASWKNPIKSEVPGRLLNVRVFKTVGSISYTPTPGTLSAYAEVHGAGGSGAGTPVTGAGQCAIGGPGASGAFASAFFPAGIPAGTTLTVGLGGAPVNGGGTNGGASSIGTLVVCPGGKTGTTAGPSAPNLVTGGGSGATATATVSGGAIAIQLTSGNSGGSSLALGLGTTAIAGTPGANGQWGGGGSVTPGNTPGNSATAPGAGGAGTATNANQASIAGGAGGNGCIVIFEYGSA